MPTRFCSDQLISIHFWISGVLALGMIETTMLFSHYLYWNDEGFPAAAIATTAVVFGVGKRAFSRIVVQFVSLGYGIVRPSIGEDFNRVLVLGGAYFTLSLIYTLSASVQAFNKRIDESEADLLSLVVFLLAGIDTIFYVWILTSIHNLLTSLAAKKQGVKYLLYRNFRAVLFISLFFTCLWALYGSILVYGDNNGILDNNWQYKWTIDAIWEFTYLALFAAIAFLWSPNKHSQRYAYSIELSQLDDDDEYNDAPKILTSNSDSTLDGEYGGRLQDEDDPFVGSGALDPHMAIAKKA